MVDNTPPTLGELQNAGTDIANLGRVTNGPVGDVTLRGGEVVPTLAKVLQTLESADVDGAVATNLQNQIDEQDLRNNRLITGALTSISWPATPDASAPFVAADVGYIWQQNTGGLHQYEIEAFSGVQLSVGQALVVDLNEAPNANGRIQPRLHALAATATPDWQTDNAVVLVVRDGDYQLGGPYIHNMRADDTERRSRRQAIAHITNLQFDGNDVTFDVSEGRVFEETQAL